MTPQQEDRIVEAAEGAAGALFWGLISVGAGIAIGLIFIAGALS